MTSYQLKLGKKVEREHLGTLRRMKAYQQKTGKCPSDKMFVESIAKDHLKENKNYYTKLKKAKL
jgi:sulfur relay (sulfurtransferase) DsrC/TusE family protein